MTCPAVHIRWKIRRDLPEVLAIEEASFEYPWAEEDFLRTLRQRNCVAMVAERDEQIVGFMVYRLMPTQLELINLAVHPARRREGVGTTLIGKLAGKLTPQRRKRLWLDVRERNLPGHLFLQACGFRAVRVLREAYDEPPGEAAYRFALRADQICDSPDGTYGQDYRERSRH
jgi:[ribosomal protein S18]-alanine N-acetyltransferase